MTAMATLADTIAQTAPDAVAMLGLRLVSATHAPQSFGNGIAIYESPDIAIRISKDRGQYMIDVARLSPNPTRWKAFGSTLGATGAVDLLGVANPDCNSLEACLSALSEHYARVVHLVNNTDFGAPD